MALKFCIIMSKHEPELTKGLVAGIAGGLLASFLMEQFQSFWNSASKKLNPRQDHNQSKEDTATVKAAKAISTGLIHQKIPDADKAAAGEIMHYLMGGSSGAIYGVAAELTPLATAGEGLAFGTTVWAAADNAIVPALGLAKPPTKTPMSMHVYALSSHLVYGFITETVRRAIRAAL
jgi:putative membrane protein